MEELTQEIVADDMLWALWRGVSDEYKERYKKDVWEHFENAVKAASYTDKTTIFVENFKKRLPCIIQQQHQKDLIKIIKSGQDYKILDWLRSETTYMVLLTRVKNEQRKESFKNIQKHENFNI